MGQIFDVVLQVMKCRFQGSHQRMDMPKIAMGVTTEAKMRATLDPINEFFQLMKDAIGLGNVTFQVMDTAMLMSY